MTSEGLWNLFLATGRPEVYTLFCRLRDEEQSDDKTA